MRTLDEIEYMKRADGLIEAKRRIAFLYVRVTQSLDEIAGYMRMSPRRIMMLAESYVCIMALAELGYHGEIDWESDTPIEQLLTEPKADEPKHHSYPSARDMYFKLRDTWDEAQGSLLKEIAKAVGVAYSTITRWRRDFWEADNEG